jgi:hypothetical protein
MKVKARTVAIGALTAAHKTAMYEVFAKYYEGVDYPTFLQDLHEKNHVILLLDAKRIVGFSTLLCRPMRLQERNVIGIFSGDTILEKNYWGSSALGKNFLRYLWLQKLRNPFMPVFWFLISKGYKTYLLMANNFETHYPRLERPTPAFEQAAMDFFYAERFGKKYDSKRGVISMGENGCRLKEFVSPITPELREGLPRVAFFENKNPQWSEGQELACIASMTALLPFQYAWKKLFRKKGRAPQEPSAGGGRRLLSAGRQKADVRIPS